MQFAFRELQELMHVLIGNSTVNTILYHGSFYFSDLSEELNFTFRNFIPARYFISRCTSITVCLRRQSASHTGCLTNSNRSLSIVWLKYDDILCWNYTYCRKHTMVVIIIAASYFGKKVGDGGSRIL
jgi:hypothetical protein